MFYSNVPHFKCKTGEKILFPFSPPIFQTEVDENFRKEMLDEGRKLNVDYDDWNSKLAGNLKYGRSYHYRKPMFEKAQTYLAKQTERWFDGMKDMWGKDNSMIKRFFTVYQGNKFFENTPEGYNPDKEGQLKLDSLWVNFSNKHDFTPPHTHTGALSFVIFLQVPERIFTVQADCNSKRAGEICFQHGQPLCQLNGGEFAVKPYNGLMFMFPAQLTHYVPPFYTDDERVSVSGNYLMV